MESEISGVHAELYVIEEGVCTKYTGERECVVRVPDGVTRLGEKLFSGHKEIREIWLPQSLTGIGKRAFEGCDGLVAVYLNNGLAELDEAAFADCAQLKSVHLPESVMRIGERLFLNCSRLQKVVLPKSLRKIPALLFDGCADLREVVWPDDPEVARIVFARCFEMYFAWEYFMLKDGVCRRVLGDVFEVCPDGELLTDNALLRRTYFKALTLLSVSSDLACVQLRCRLKIFRIFMAMAAILTKRDPCAMFWAARGCIQYVFCHAMEKEILSQSDRVRVIRQALLEIGGNGRHVFTRDMMLFKENMQKLYNEEAAFRLYEADMMALGVEECDFHRSCLRYHPWHWTNAAWLERHEEKNYWAFAQLMDGLIQNIQGGRHLHYELYVDSEWYIDWLVAWSQALYEHDLGIIEFRFPPETRDPDTQPRLFFAIEYVGVYDHLVACLKDLNCEHILHFWYNGRDKNTGLAFA